MAEKAELVAFSCYIWNIEQTLRIVSDIKKISPETLIVLGGPEVSFDVFGLMDQNPAVDFIVKGEGETAFRRLIETLIREEPCLLVHSLAEIDNLFFRDSTETVAGPLNNNNLRLDLLPSPFEAGWIDFSKPLIYFETSRGCPFSCAFCLSSVDRIVRSFSMDRIKKDLLFLMNKEVANIKLVDRTFNYDSVRAGIIWEFILEHNRSSHFHFEIAADLLTTQNLDILSRVPEKTFRFEIGIQSTSESTLEQVQRSADLQRIFTNIRQLAADTKIELHLDLVAGLPGETYCGFLSSLQTVADLQPDDIQIEPLKLLKGSPMREIGRREGYEFSEFPPYTILKNPWLSYQEICRVVTIGRLLDLFNKHGGFNTAFTVLQRNMKFSEIIDRMAIEAGDENLSSFSIRGVFELFARLAEPFIGNETKKQFNDALFFDYCKCEMPLMGKLPSFISEHQNRCSWPGRKDFPVELSMPANSRVKAFRFVFEQNYLNKVWNSEQTPLIFVYISGPGNGLHIEVLS
jgi:anaerobic magnesium-protoporphyrin IX monomethyl ester cyclase